MKPLLPVIAMVAIGLAATPALGQPNARAEFDVAQKLFDEGRQAEALPRFRAAYQASKSPNARLMVARCLIAIGKTAEAYEEMAATTRDATARAEADPKYAATRDSAAAELALLERRVGAVVTLNGAPLAADRLGVPVAVEPGKVVVEVSRASGKPDRREVTIGAGETKTVTFAITAASSGPVGPIAPPPPPPPPQETRGGGVRVAGFVVAGLGVAGMGLFAGAGLMANSKFATLQKECGSARCADPKYADTVDAGKTLDLLANIGLGVGAAGIASGALMIALGGPKKAPPRAAWLIGPTSVGIAGQF
jgi:hypothetical protein